MDIFFFAYSVIFKPNNLNIINQYVRKSFIKQKIKTYQIILFIVAEVRFLKRVRHLMCQ